MLTKIALITALAAIATASLAHKGHKHSQKKKPAAPSKEEKIGRDCVNAGLKKLQDRWTKSGFLRRNFKKYKGLKVDFKNCATIIKGCDKHLEKEAKHCLDRKTKNKFRLMKDSKKAYYEHRDMMKAFSEKFWAAMRKERGQKPPKKTKPMDPRKLAKKEIMQKARWCVKAWFNQMSGWKTYGYTKVTLKKCATTLNNFKKNPQLNCSRAIKQNAYHCLAQRVRYLFPWKTNPKLAERDWTKMKVEFMKRMDAALKKAREPVAPPCVDKEKECKHWAHIGYCKLIPEFMQEKCKASCNKCPVSRDFKKKYQRFTTEHCNYDCVQHNLKWIKKHTQFSHNLIQSTFKRFINSARKQSMAFRDKEYANIMKTKDKGRAINDALQAAFQTRSVVSHCINDWRCFEKEMNKVPGGSKCLSHKTCRQRMETAQQRPFMRNALINCSWSKRTCIFDA